MRYTYHGTPHRAIGVASALSSARGIGYYIAITIHRPFFHSLTYRIYDLIPFFNVIIYQVKFLIISRYVTPNGMCRLGQDRLSWLDRRRLPLHAAGCVHARLSLQNLSHPHGGNRGAEHTAAAILVLSLSAGSLAHFRVLGPLHPLFFNFGPGGIAHGRTEPYALLLTLLQSAVIFIRLIRDCA